MCKMLNIYRAPISVLTPLKLKIRQLTKKEEPLNLNNSEPNGVKSLAFLVSL